MRTKITNLEREIEKLKGDYNFMIVIPSNSQYFRTKELLEKVKNLDKELAASKAEVKKGNQNVANEELQN